MQLTDETSDQNEDGATVSDALERTDSEQVVQKKESAEVAENAETDSDETS